MGISSIAGIQFFERLKLFFMPVKHHSSSYVRRVSSQTNAKITYMKKSCFIALQLIFQVATFKMHLYTLIQLLCLVALWVVKSTQLSLAFPFFLLLMVPLRAQLSKIFSPKELRAVSK